MSFRTVKNADDAIEYVAGLNERWPARREIMEQILTQVRRVGVERPTVLDLCCGSGILGNYLLSGMSHALYTGIDQSRPLLDAAEETFASVRQQVTLLERDLNQDEWHEEIVRDGSQFEAIVSMQSLHDLGGESEVSRIYELSRKLLVPDGLFINADLIVEPGAPLPDNPGRLTVERHLELLMGYGFGEVACVAETGGFGVVVGRC